jgi:hypothetical protein
VGSTGQRSTLTGLEWGLVGRGRAWTWVGLGRPARTRVTTRGWPRGATGPLPGLVYTWAVHGGCVVGSIDPSRGPRWTGFTLSLLLSTHGGLGAPTAPSSPSLPPLFSHGGDACRRRARPGLSAATLARCRRAGFVEEQCTSSAFPHPARWPEVVEAARPNAARRHGDSGGWRHPLTLELSFLP